MQKVIMTLVFASFTLCGCIVTPTKPVGSGISQEKVGTKVLALVRGIKWDTQTGGFLKCDPSDPNSPKSLTPTWARFTLSTLNQKTIDGSGLAGAGKASGGVLPITPSAGIDLKTVNANQTDTVVTIRDLASYKDWQVPETPETIQLTKLITDAENDLVNGGDSKKPCITVESVAVTTVLDVTETDNGEVKIGIGPIVIADVKASDAKEAKATLKIEVHYIGSPPSGNGPELIQVLKNPIKFPTKP